MKQKAVRITMYAPHDLSPTTVVIMERDIDNGMTVAELCDHHARVAMPGTFCVFDTFETEDDMVRASIHAGERIRPEDERNMAISYYYNAAMLRQVADGGVLTNPAPAPLTVEDITAVLKALAFHPNYSSDKTIQCFTALGGHQLVELRNGEVSASAVE